jgi:translation initiation factor 1
MSKQSKAVGTVYSTELGTICPQCGNPVADCRCKQNEAAAAGNGIVRLSYETKGRKGKGATVIRGLPLSRDQLKMLTKKLKQKCGTGGTLKDSNIEIQGDHRMALIEELSKQGFKVKPSGG